MLDLFNKLVRFKKSIRNNFVYIQLDMYGQY